MVASSEIGNIARHEQAVLDRVRNGSVLWTPVGRDGEGRLVLEAVLSAGARNPDMARRCRLAVGVDGHWYSSTLIAAPQ